MNIIQNICIRSIVQFFLLINFQYTITAGLLKAVISTLSCFDDSVIQVEHKVISQTDSSLVFLIELNLLTVSRLDQIRLDQIRFIVQCLLNTYISHKITYTVSRLVSGDLLDPMTLTLFTVLIGKDKSNCVLPRFIKVQQRCLV